MGKSIPAGFTTKVTNGTVLIDVLNKAADAGNQGSFNKYDTTYYKGLGYAITAMNGIKQDHGTATYWAIIDGKTGGSIPCGISSYVPASNSITVFRFTQTFGHNGPVSGYCKTAAPSSNQVSQLLVNNQARSKDFSLKKPVRKARNKHTIFLLLSCTYLAQNCLIDLGEDKRDKCIDV